MCSDGKFREALCLTAPLPVRPHCSEWFRSVPSLNRGALSRTCDSLRGRGAFGWLDLEPWANPRPQESSPGNGSNRTTAARCGPRMAQAETNPKPDGRCPHDGPAVQSTAFEGSLARRSDIVSRTAARFDELHCLPRLSSCGGA